MTFSFGSQKNEAIYGTYGEFTVGSISNRIKAQFILTKMKPGVEGSWENLLASQMVPWREIFNIEELTFDELLQRDLDDSRVAHELIPYLLGEKEAAARFFPPILAVLVPKNPQQTGIQPYYPKPDEQSDVFTTFGELFDFRKVEFNGSTTPLGEIKYNRQKTSFVIVDGQHRAMAVLALHRQINSIWGADRYASFYNHLTIEPDQIKSIELPVCIIFFPELYQDNTACIEKGLDLKKVCREIFLVVNKTAKKVSQSRELLLDDEDFAARMMRTTLSKLKGRGEDTASIARIYSFAFGDSDTDSSKQVLAGQLEYTSAVVLHRMHAAAAFGVSDAFNFDKPSDITEKRKIKNSERPSLILIGTSLQKWNSLSRFSGKYHPPQDVEDAVRQLAEISDIPLLKLFDEFHPFAIHNSVMRELRTRLSDPEARADLIQSKCYSLLFEGSGVRYVFEDHQKTLKKRKDELIEEGKTPSDYIINQLNDANAIIAALDKYEERIKAQRACKLFSIDYVKFFAAENNDTQRKSLLSKAKPIFDTISTQAFQLGYLMAVHSIVEAILEPGTVYAKRLRLIDFVSDIIVNALNTYFSSDSTVEHHTFTGLVNESRINVFDQNELGLRRLLSKELNERQWTFFRYAILEMVHCRYSYRTVLHDLNSVDDSALADMYKNCLPELIENILRLREQYIVNMINSVLSEFELDTKVLKARLEGEGKSDVEIDEIVKEKELTKQSEVRDQCGQNISASLGEFASASEIIARIIELE
jgi:DNA-sulfur modification-associated